MDWGIVKTRASKLAVAVVCIELLAMPLVLVQLLASKPGTAWRVLELNAVFVLVCIAVFGLLTKVSKTPVARLGIVARVVFSALGFTFAMALGQTFTALATQRETLGQMAHRFGVQLPGAFLGALTVVAMIELWRSTKPLDNSYKTKLRISWSVATVGLLVMVVGDVLSFHTTRTVGASVSLVGFLSALAIWFTGWLAGDNNTPNHSAQNAR